MWLDPIDQYCERLGPGLWAEPLNFLTNAGFLIAAFLLTRPQRGYAGVPRFNALAFLLFAIGVGSGLFHSFANVFTNFCDIIPIALFLFTYLWFFAERVIRLEVIGRVIILVGFLALTVIGSLVSDSARVNGSNQYFGAWVALFGIAAYVAGGAHRQHARYFFAAHLIFTVSLFARSLDMELCASWPRGTHFVWHLLNSVTLYLVLLGYAKILKGAGRLAGPKSAGEEK